MSRPERLGRHQLARIAADLSSRDLAILTALHRYTFLRHDQIRDLAFTNHSSQDSAARIARRVLERLFGLGLVRRLDRRIGGIRSGSEGHVYVLTSAGHRLLATGVPPLRHEPGLRHLNHSLARNDLLLAAQLTATANGFEVLASQTEPECWRPITGNRRLKPDGFIHLANADVELAWFIEIDCGTESGTTIAGKCHTYLDHQRTDAEQDQLGFYPRIVFVAPDADRADRLQEVISTQRPPPHLFVVTTSAEALALITDFDDP